MIILINHNFILIKSVTYEWLLYFFIIILNWEWDKKQTPTPKRSNSLLEEATSRVTAVATGAIRTTEAMIRKEGSGSSSKGMTVGKAEEEEETDGEASRTSVEERRKTATLIGSCATIGSLKGVEIREMEVFFYVCRRSRVGKGKAELRNGWLLEKQAIITQTRRVIVYEQIINYSNAWLKKHHSNKQ